MFSSPVDAYERGSKSTASSRDLEAAALFKAARLLEACRAEWDAPGCRERVEAALRNNQRLWTLFQSELMRPDHALPTGVRANVLRLAEFVDRRTVDIFSAPESEKLRVLIEINRNVAAGLSERRV